MSYWEWHRSTEQRRRRREIQKTREAKVGELSTPMRGVLNTIHTNPKRRANRNFMQGKIFHEWRHAIRQEKANMVFLKGEKYRQWVREKTQGKTQVNVMGVSSTPSRGVFSTKFFRGEPITHETVFRGNQPTRVLDAMAAVGIQTKSEDSGASQSMCTVNVGDNRDTSFKGELLKDSDEDTRTFEELRRKSPSQFAEYLTDLV
ncbi:hypothetical protein B0H10DRAFT_1944489 [Mycena sp. CBHHK59/15]|nr:hypothetical protein B0H10DRAFT_1944489 [Mycena sp. CBHHK59/15]